MNNAYISVQIKILSAVALVFLLAVILVTGYSAKQQKERLLTIAESEAEDLINSYFDSMNVMMFTGTMAKRGVLKEKMLVREGVESIRMVRGDLVSKFYGPGWEDEAPTDELDARGLAGEQVVEVDESGAHRVLDITYPINASDNYNGTNCLTCHPVGEGTTLGAVRLRFSLEEKDAAVDKELLVSAGINFVIVVVGLGLLHWWLRRIAIHPLVNLRNTVELVESEVDLRPRVEISANDEFREVAEAFNNMLNRFQPMIKEMVSEMGRLSHNSDQMARIAEETESGIVSQEAQLGQLAGSSDGLSEVSHNVSDNATKAEQVVQLALAKAADGQNVVNQVVDTIAQLAERMGNASSVVQQLAQGTEQIGKVSESITSIAGQTNLLALNAAIEAARAGEQGRGFAVVADEVRSLAQRTQEATKEIQQILDQLYHSSQEAVSVMADGKGDVDRSVEESRHAGEVLGEIASAVGSMTEMNSRISTTAEEQDRVVEDLNKSLHAINKVTQKTANGARETANSSEEVASIATRLGGMLGQFKV